VTTRVLVVDDQRIVRAGFSALLDAQPDLEVVGDAENGRQAVDCARRLRPDVVLMDVRMPEVDGLEATRLLLADHAPSPPRVLGSPPSISTSTCTTRCARARAGSCSRTRRLRSWWVRCAAPPAALTRLTARESEVLTLVARGLSNAEIADELVVAEQTVKTHVSRVLAKLGLHDRVQAVVLAYESGLLAPGD